MSKSITIKGELFDRESGELIENHLFITLHQSPDGKITNDGTILFEKLIPDYDQKNLFLNLDKFRIEVFFTLVDWDINKIYNQTHYLIQFSGQTWQSPPCVQYLDNLFLKSR